MPVLLTATGKPRCKGRQCGDKIPGTAPARYTPKQCTRAYVPGSKLPLCKIHEEQKQRTNAAIAAAKAAGKKPDTKNLRSHGIYGEKNLPEWSMIGEMIKALDDAVAGAGSAAPGSAAPAVKKAKAAVKTVEVAVQEAVVAGKRADRKKDEVEAAISFAMAATNKAIATLGAVRKSRKANSPRKSNSSSKSNLRKTKKSRSSSGSSSSGSSSSGSNSNSSSSNNSFAREVLATKPPTKAVIYKPVSVSTSPSFPPRPASRSPPSATLPRGPNPSPVPESYSPITEPSASAPSNGSAISSLSGSPSSGSSSSGSPSPVY